MMEYTIAGAILVTALINIALVVAKLALYTHRYSSLSASDTPDAPDQPAVIKQLYERIGLVGKALRIGTNVCLLAQGVLFYALINAVTAFSEYREAVILLIALIGAWACQQLSGYILPRAISSAYYGAVIDKMGGCLLLYQKLLYPLVYISEKVEKKIAAVISNGKVVNLQEFGMEVQIQAINQDDIEPSPVARRIFRNALKMSSLLISDVLLPRHQVHYMDLNDSLEENLKRARESGHTRFPLCRGGMDHCIGLVHIKDLFKRPPNADTLNLVNIKRDISRLSIDEPLEGALERLLMRRMHMALVVDEFGGVAGVLTLENILEELVGDIQDEFDADESLIIPRGGGEYWVSGLAPIHDVEEVLGYDIVHDEVSTVGGLITAELGRIPKKGETFEIEAAGLSVKIEEVNERRVIAVFLKRVEREEEKSAS